MEIHDTICAVATARGRAALGILRISGPQALAIFRSVQLRPKEIPVRQASLVQIQGADGQILDEVIAIYYKAPQSYTGEDVIELICHGNPIIMREIEGLFVSRGTRLAEAGEFTRRALANGKMTLSQVESLDLILNSSSKIGVSVGLQTFQSKFELKLGALLESLRELIVEFQAQLDFPEHEVGTFSSEYATKLIQDLQDQIRRWLKAYENYRHYLGRRKIVFLGPPNSGKSSLFNALVGFDKAIVFDQPGTTRDSLDYLYEKRGLEIHLVDTAGIRDTSNEIERLGIERSKKEAIDADLIVWLSDNLSLPPEALRRELADKKWLFVHSKSDLGHSNSPDWISVSIFDQNQLRELESMLFGDLIEASANSEDVFISSDRQYEALQMALQKLQEVSDRLQRQEPLEWIAQSVLESASHLESLVGKVPHEDVLRTILGRFCIGK